MLSRVSAAFALVVGLLVAQASYSQVPNRWSIGANVGRSDFGDCPAFASCDTKDTGFRVYGGYQFHENFAAEIGYVDLGKTTARVAGRSADNKTRGVSAHLVGSWPVIERLSILGKVGAIYGESKVGGAFGSRKDRGTQLAYGGGLRYDVTNAIGIRAEWERYRFDTVNGKNDVDLISLGVQFRF